MNKTLTNALDEIKHEESYENILCEHIKECKKRIKLINKTKTTQKLKDFVRNYPDFIKLMNLDVDRDVCHISNKYKSLDFRVQYYYQFKIGLLALCYSYTGDDRGWGNICVDVNGFELSRKELPLEHLDDKELSGMCTELINSGINNISEDDEDIISRFIMDICRKDYDDWFKF